MKIDLILTKKVAQFKKNIGLIYILALCITPLNAQDSLKIMTYNLLNYPDVSPARISYLKTIMQYTKPDLLLVNELSNGSGANDILVQALNQDGISYYSMPPFINYAIQNNMLFYDSRKIGLLLSDTIDASPRPINYFKVYLKDWALSQTQDTTIIHLFSLHLKALSGSAYEQKRYEAADKLRQFIDNNLDGQHILVAGDFNIYKSSEPSILVLVDSGSYELYDPLETSGTFHDNAQFTTIHTQSTRTIDLGDDGATGGMDDRFDLILCSEDIFNGTGDLESLPLTYKALGNDGQHLNMSITDLPAVTIYPSSLINALYNFSDHLPVVYTLKTDKDLVDGLENKINNGLKWHFNRGESILTIKSKDLKFTRLSVYNNIGQMCKADINMGLNDLTINMNSLAFGHYIVRLITDNKVYSFRFIR